MIYHVDDKTNKQEISVFMQDFFVCLFVCLFCKLSLFCFLFRSISAACL